MITFFRDFALEFNQIKFVKLLLSELVESPLLRFKLFFEPFLLFFFRKRCCANFKIFNLAFASRCIFAQFLDLPTVQIVFSKRSNTLVYQRDSNRFQNVDLSSVGTAFNGPSSSHHQFIYITETIECYQVCIRVSDSAAPAN
jgi:hypothetical protein